MRKLVYIALASSFGTVFAQEVTVTKDVNLYNRWSFEVQTGQNKPVRPFATGYYSSDPNKLISISGTNHMNVGVRYMLSNAFGLKLDYARDQFTPQSGAGSLSFDTQLYRFGLQGVMNLGGLLHFESFTNRVSVLVHAGVHVSQFYVNEGASKNLTEGNGGVMFGITPQIRLTKWVALIGDFTVVNNVRQHLNWDGSYASTEENLSGVLYNTSLGLTFYLGKKDKHADWYTKEDVLSKLPTIDKEARKRLDEIETAMNDTDRDGILDYLDAENNTPGGVAVDSKGRFIDTNINETPDEMEPRNGTDNSSTQIMKKLAAESELVENGLINVFFDVNEATPNQGSSNNLFIILKYLQNNPTAKVKLYGFADKRGNEALNFNLSTQRAQKVNDFLIANGVPTSHVSIEGVGADTKFIDNSEASLTLARRVSVEIVKQ